jgi:hypothetical protein
MVKKIELVVHCYRYSRVLSYFLSSIDMFRTPSAIIRATVFCAVVEGDKPTWDVLQFFRDRWKDTPGLILNPWALMQPRLLRRAIGRNLAALATTADLVWFLDADYVFGPTCLETLATMELSGDKLFYPRTVLISKDHATGDKAALRAAAGPGLYTVHPSDFIESNHRAIGGLQIVPGDVAREYGYCDGIAKHQRLVEDGEWKDTKGDITYRKTLGTKGTAIELPNLYRIRQTTEGVVDTLESAPE